MGKDNKIRGDIDRRKIVQAYYRKNNNGKKNNVVIF